MSEIDTETKIAKPTTKLVNMDDIQQHPENPRYHSREQIEELASSLDDHTYYTVSMLVSSRTGNVVIGNGMYSALQLRGFEQVLVGWKDMTPEEELQILIRDNRLSELSSWIMPMLNADLSTLIDAGLVLEDMAFTMEAMEGLDVAEMKRQADNRVVKQDDPPEVDEGEPITQAGDLWLLGSHRVLCADSTKEAAVERVMGGKKADICVTSPPYFNQRPEYAEFENYELFNKFLETVLIEIKTIAGDPFVLAWNTGDNQPDCLPMIADQTVLIHSIGFIYLDTIIWRKAGAIYSIPRSAHIRANHKYYPALCWEPVIIFRLGDNMPSFDAADVEAISSWGMNVWDINQVVGSEQSKIGHPAIYPIMLAARCQMAYSSAQSLVYDPFLGSGTTLIAADQLNRKCYGIEIAPRYVDVVIKRYINHAGSSDDVFVERDGKRLSWGEAQEHLVIAGQKVHVC